MAKGKWQMAFFIRAICSLLFAICYLLGDPLGFFYLIHRFAYPDGVPRRVLCPERFGVAILVIARDRRRGVNDISGRAVIFFEERDPGAGPVLFEPKEDREGGVAPSIDQLFVVAHDAHIPMRAREEFYELILHGAHVLILVDKERLKFVLVFYENVWTCAEKFHGLCDKVGKVESVVLRKRSFV